MDYKLSKRYIFIQNVIHMLHSYNRIWIRAIWSTKERKPSISTSIEQKVYQFISEQCREKGRLVRIVNGMPDHIHVLFLLNPRLSISELIKQIKGSSSHFINQNNFISEKFTWQTGYALFSVSESVVERVYRYIRNQKQHHHKKSFQQEYNEI